MSWTEPFLSSAGDRLLFNLYTFEHCVKCGWSAESDDNRVRQMRRYNIPRLCFINKLDRAGAKPWSVIDQMRTKLQLNCAAVQFPIGLEDKHQGVIDIINNRAYYSDGIKGLDSRFHL